MSEPRIIGLAGIYCPKCGGCNSGVVDKRNKDGYLRRRRKCKSCDELFTTKEQIVIDSKRGKISLTESDTAIKELRENLDVISRRLSVVQKILGTIESTPV